MGLEKTWRFRPTLVAAAGGDDVVDGNIEKESVEDGGILSGGGFYIAKIIKR